MVKRSGIYKITNTVNGKVYIGQSEWVKKRIGAHKYKLDKGTHNNVHLQRAYDKYGADAFLFEVVEYCDEDSLDEREMFYISYYDSMRNGYNQTLGGGGNRGYVMSEETRKKLRERHIDVSGKNNPMYGRSWKDMCTDEEIEEHSRKLREYWAANPPSTKAVICVTDGRVFKSCKAAADEFGISEWNIGNCCRRTTNRCGWFENGMPIVCLYKDDYDKMADDDIAQIIAAANRTSFGENNPNAKSVVNLTTGVVYKTAKDAARELGIKASGISSNIIGQHLSAGKSDDGTKYVWVRYSDYINMTREQIEAKVSYAQNANHSDRKPNARPVVCVNTGDTFATVTEAGKVYHVDPSSIVACCKGKLKSCGKINDEKLVWRYAS